MLPRDVPGFTGRAAEMNRLTAIATTGRMQVVAISGAAGVGKTALAVHAAHSLLEHFPDGHLHADLYGHAEKQATADPALVLETFLRQLGVSANEVPPSKDERSAMLRSLLAPRRALVLLDNAVSEEQVIPLLPGAGTSLVIVTSRSALAGLEADHHLSLDIMPGDEASTLMIRLMGADRAAAEPQAVEQILESCGRLPLALRIAGQILVTQPAWAASKLASMLADEEQRLRQLTAGNLQVRAAFDASYRQLPLRDATVFRLLGLHPGPDFDINAVAALAKITIGETEQAINRMARAYLVTESRPGRYTMHDLVRLFAHDACHQADGPAARNAAEDRLISHYINLAKFLERSLPPRSHRERVDNPDSSDQTQAPLPAPQDAVMAFEAERFTLLAVTGLAARRGRVAELKQLANSLSQPLTSLWHPDDEIVLWTTMLAAARKAREAGNELAALNNLGQVHQNLRQFDAAARFIRQALQVARTLGDQEAQVSVLSNLGTLLADTGRFREAIDRLEEALSICNETGNQIAPKEPLAGLGIVYSKMERPESAASCFEKALAVQRETGNTSVNAATLANLGNAYHALGRETEAISCHEQALAMYREAGDLHGEGLVLVNLGSAYSQIERPYDAIRCFVRSGEIAQEQDDPHSEGLALINAGTVFAELGKAEESVNFFAHAASMLADTDDERAFGTALANLGMSCLVLSRFNEARQCYEDAHAIFQDLGDRFAQARVLAQLGDAQKGLKHRDQAAACWLEAAAILHDIGNHQTDVALLEEQAAKAGNRRRRWHR